MKKKYIIGLVVGIVFVAIAVLAFDTTKIEYADFQKAQNSGKVVQVIGSWDKANNYDYNSQTNEFKFTMVDEHGNKADVIAVGGKPNNFDVAPMVVIKGKYENGKFHASEILTKCPSKYEGQFDEMKGKQLYKQ